MFWSEIEVCGDAANWFDISGTVSLPVKSDCDGIVTAGSEWGDSPASSVGVRSISIQLLSLGVVFLVERSIIPKHIDVNIGDLSFFEHETNEVEVHLVTFGDWAGFSVSLSSVELEILVIRVAWAESNGSILKNFSLS